MSDRCAGDRRHDQSYKLLFSLSLAIEHMIRGFIDGDLAGELDFERVENLATERTTPGLVRSQADMRRAPAEASAPAA